jgi:hypothetical protein
MSRCRKSQLLLSVGTLLILSGTTTLAQMDTFGSQGAPSISVDCQGDKDRAIYQLRMDEQRANDAFKQENLRCNAGRDSACVAELAKQMHLAQIRFTKRDMEAEAARQICVERQRLATAAPAGPCERQYLETIVALNIENIQTQTKLKEDNLDCNREPGQDCKTSRPDVDALDRHKDEAAARRRECEMHSRQTPAKAAPGRAQQGPFDSRGKSQSTQPPATAARGRAQQPQLDPSGNLRPGGWSYRDKDTSIYVDPQTHKRFAFAKVTQSNFVDCYLQQNTVRVQKTGAGYQARAQCVEDPKQAQNRYINGATGAVKWVYGKELSE